MFEVAKGDDFLQGKEAQAKRIVQTSLQP